MPAQIKQQVVEKKKIITKYINKIYKVLTETRKRMENEERAAK